MALRTKQELATRVLRKMRIAGMVQAPSSEDVAHVSDAYDSKYSEWQVRKIAYWPNTSLSAEEIPEEVFNPLVDLLVNEVSGDYGKDSMTPLERRMMEERLLQHVRRHTQTLSSELPTQTDYY